VVSRGLDASNRQTRKRLATRQKISDVATRLFFEHGFEKVTVDEIAEAADVSRMTVFNHFSRKEDMFFDLDERAREDLLNALKERERGTSPVEALRLFVHRAVTEQRPYGVFFGEDSLKFMATIQASETLKARARAIRDELSDLLAAALARSTKRSLTDPAASLAAALLLATWTVALTEARANYGRDRDVEKAIRLFSKLVNQGTRGVQAALKGTPYV
jgi:AcrR family transcriptional regulator